MNPHTLLIFAINKKFQNFCPILMKLGENDHQVIIFTKFHEDTTKIMDFL